MRSVARDRWTILDADSCAVRTLRLLDTGGLALLLRRACITRRRAQCGLWLGTTRRVMDVNFAGAMRTLCLLARALSHSTLFHSADYGF